MVDMGSRVQRALAELTGNEALLGMLDTDAASEMLNWGISMSTSIVNDTDGQDDLLADLSLLPRLKAVRQAMRSIGNWAAGHYVEAESRIQLRDKLLSNFKAIFQDEARVPSAEALDELLNQVDDKGNTAHQLVLNLMRMVIAQDKGEN